MLWYLLRRLVGTLILAVVVAVVTFALISLAPGDTALTLAGSAGGDPEYLALLRQHLGLDRPLPYQVGAYLGGVLQGDLGFSAVQGRPVLDVILGRVPSTLLLAGTAMVLSSVGGVILGVVAGARQRTRIDTVISLGSLVAYSLPVFWVGQLLVGFVAVRLGWLPAGGMTSIGPALSGPQGLLDLVRHLVLPVSALSLLLLGLVVRTTRTAMIEVLDEDYMRTARGSGIARGRRLFLHALPNALRPVVTVVASQLAFVLTGTVLIETVFAWPGLGRLLLDSVLARDNPVLVGLLLFSALVVAIANFVADVLYALLDPRVRYW